MTRLSIFYLTLPVVLFLSTEPVIATELVSSSLNDLKKISKVTMDKNQQLVAFFRRLKLALDVDAIGQPESLRNISGLEILEWEDPELEPPRIAKTFRFHVPVMDDMNVVGAKGSRPFGFSYGIHVPSKDGPNGYRLDIWDIARLGCVSPEDVTSIFGSATIRVERRGISPHGNAQADPAWLVGSYYYDPKLRRLLTIAYQYQDEENPVPVCLNGFSVTVNVSPPVGY